MEGLLASVIKPEDDEASVVQESVKNLADTRLPVLQAQAEAAQMHSITTRPHTVAMTQLSQNEASNLVGAPTSIPRSIEDLGAQIPAETPLSSTLIQDQGNLEVNALTSTPQLNIKQVSLAAMGKEESISSVLMPGEGEKRLLGRERHVEMNFRQETTLHSAMLQQRSTVSSAQGDGAGISFISEAQAGLSPSLLTNRPGAGSALKLIGQGDETLINASLGRVEASAETSSEISTLDGMTTDKISVTQLAQLRQGGAANANNLSNSAALAAIGSQNEQGLQIALGRMPSNPAIVDEGNKGSIGQIIQHDQSAALRAQLQGKELISSTSLAEGAVAPSAEKTLTKSISETGHTITERGTTLVTAQAETAEALVKASTDISEALGNTATAIVKAGTDVTAAVAQTAMVAAKAGTSLATSQAGVAATAVKSGAAITGSALSTAKTGTARVAKKAKKVASYAKSKSMSRGDSQVDEK